MGTRPGATPHLARADAPGRPPQTSARFDHLQLLAEVALAITRRAPGAPPADAGPGAGTARDDVPLRALIAG